jgi:hypothetical protein
MKKSLFTIVMFLGTLSVMLTSCVKDILDVDDQWGGTYELYMDGDLIIEGSTEQVGMMGYLASVSNGDEFGLLVANVPGSKGGVTQIDDEEEGGLVTITGRNLLMDDSSDELYMSISGTITRESSSKITFEGTCTSFLETETHTFSGTLESNAFKLML